MYLRRYRCGLLVCDGKYQPSKIRRAAKRQGQRSWCPRLFLHSTRTICRDLDGTALNARCALPVDLSRALELLAQVTPSCV